jgi:hypothetical protein
VPEGHRESAGYGETRGEPGDPRIGRRLGDVDDTKDRRPELDVVILDIARAHHVHRLSGADGRSEARAGAGFGKQRQLGAVGSETDARAPQQLDGCEFEVTGFEERLRGLKEESEPRLLTAHHHPGGTGSRKSEDQDREDGQPGGHG